ncbi:pentafunctional AROM polypeptide [Pneumocystis jirovecii RU7]|uniref:Pentafunctional AROM polypeptide n=1 Tax=Pneumocystis jirovecii (strain RU7) TaxID=1408657 RepID=A0A0W4ZPZ1_PNEJ7|nr:pentafunctional AROM polypeptide [Pneumocystis jirovecii RU7]KTW30439.1 pentafunctional AROM polypeptide [Pneumocystis jirovecii RU7]
MKNDKIIKFNILEKDSIHFGYNLWSHIINELFTYIFSPKYVVITDSNIESLYIPDFKNYFKSIAKQRSINSCLLYFTIPSGEKSKSRKTKAIIEDWLLSEKCTKDTVIIAMGGGVVGDLVGYVSATFMRGVRFVQIPTTLLAMIDSSIGGKTSINIPYGKNMIGAIWQPERIFIDLTFLKTLTEREFINGVAELIKTIIIWDESEFILLEDLSKKVIKTIKSKSATSNQYSNFYEIIKDLERFILSSIKIKAYIVSIDEREKDLRNILNFGHSIGHAIETVLASHLLHGECVSIGMIKEAEISRYLGILNPNVVSRLTECLNVWGLPISLKQIQKTICKEDRLVENILEVMALDKKNDSNNKKIVLLSAIGKTYEKKASSVSDDIIRTVLSENIVLYNIPLNIHKKHITITLPGSKSISNRALILAALSSGICRLKNFLHSDDTYYMLSALEKLNAAEFKWEEGGNILVIKGKSGYLENPKMELYLGNSGTASRFLTTICTLVPPNSCKDNIILTGDNRMKQRPIDSLVNALNNNGCNIEYLESNNFLPLLIKPKNPGFYGGRINLSATISSQYVSSILMCSPYAETQVTLSLIGGKPISQPYIDMTISMMSLFGINVIKSHLEENTYYIPKGCYTCPPEYIIEGDASSATYPLAIAAITGESCTISNIGSISLQGDSKFAKDVLKPMGCEVIQSDTTTYIKGPEQGKLKSLESINMELMTDAFLTTTILASVAYKESKPCITKITGISNQRLKECNRIKAMVIELAKFGIEAGELPDGIYVKSLDISNLLSPKNGINCYNDHRIAMSFSVLACISPKPTIILGKTCVNKTWPYWWDILNSAFKVQIRGAESTLNSIFNPYILHHPSKCTIIFIGMKGAGKTTLGQFAANLLEREFIDLDLAIEKDVKMTILELVQKHGWDTFRKKELYFLKNLLAEKKENYIISCGGGIIESEEARDILLSYIKNKGIVIHIHRNIKDIIEYLNTDKTRPTSTGNIIDIWEKRKQWYNLCSSHQFYIPSTDSIKVREKDTLLDIKPSFHKFLKIITGEYDPFPQILKKERSYFISLALSDIQNLYHLLDDITIGCDAIELRIDLFQKQKGINKYPSLKYIAEQISLLRQKTNFPLIYTLRTTDHGGSFVFEEKIAKKIILHGAKLGVEFIDIQLNMPTKLFKIIQDSWPYTKIIASFHSIEKPISCDDFEWIQKYKEAQQHGHIVKLVGMSTSFEDNFLLKEFKKKIAYEKIPSIIINTGINGQLSRIINVFMTPVTHSLLSSKTALGQLSIKDINIALHIMGLLPKKEYFLFGSPIKHSQSPNIHNLGFEILGFPHKYQLFETNSINELKNILYSDNFGGASVTAPLKTSIPVLLDELSDEAVLIGAVNTITKIHKNGKHILKGENTDWQGIVKVITNSIKFEKSLKGFSGFIIGAGGASRAAIYALLSIKISPIYIINRSKTKLDKICSFFNTKHIIPITECFKLDNIDFNIRIGISTIPADNPVDSSILEMAKILFNSKTKSSESVFLDMSYKPHITELTTIAKTYNWKTIHGLEILLEQGSEQFLLWTKTCIPYNQVKRAIVTLNEHTTIT